MKNAKVVAALSAVALGAMGLRSASATVITSWNFENNTVAVNNSPTPSTGVGTATPIGMNVYATPNIGVNGSDVVVGKSSDTGANTNSDTSQTWRVRAGNTASGAAANGWSSAAPIGTQGAVFAASTVGYSSVTVGFDWYATTQGEANLMLAYTNDDSVSSPTWINVPISYSAAGNLGLATVVNTGSDANSVTGTYISDNVLTNGAPAGQNWFANLTATITDPLAANDPNFAFELVNASTGVDDVSTAGTALNNTSGNWRFDRVSINGTSVPEPTTLSLLAAGGLALIGRRRKNV